MTGAIWLVQVLVYPNFRVVGKAEFKKFHEFHMNRITWIVAPVMIVELVTGVWLLVSLQNTFYILNLIGVLALWILTSLVNVPRHNRLDYDCNFSKDHLVFWNWPRTFLWSIRSVVLCLIAFEQISK